MSSQFNSYLLRSKPINKYGEEANCESHRFGKHKEKTGVKTKKQQPVFPSNRNEPVWCDQIQQIQGELGSDTLMMADDNNNKTLGLSSSTKEALETNQIQELNGATTVHMPLMESMIHNRRCLSYSINGVVQSVDEQEIQGTTLGIQVMEVNNHIKTGLDKPIMRQQKKKKSPK